MHTKYFFSRYPQFEVYVLMYQKCFIYNLNILDYFLKSIIIVFIETTGNWKKVF